MEQMSLSKAKAVKLEKEMANVNEELETQKASYKSQLEFFRAAHQDHITTLEKEVDDNYNEGLRHSYRCIMLVLKRQYPDLKMDELAAGVTKYMNEQTTVVSVVSMCKCTQ